MEISLPCLSSKLKSNMISCVYVVLDGKAGVLGGVVAPLDVLAERLLLGHAVLGDLGGELVDQIENLDEQMDR